MAEAEDVITDAARHASGYAMAWWRRHRPPSRAAAPLQLSELAPRLSLLAGAVFQRDFRLRVAQPAAPPTWLGQMFHPGQAPAHGIALPATDGQDIWLPASLGPGDSVAAATARYRVLTLQQAMRAVRGSAACAPPPPQTLAAAVYLLLEARAADDALARLLPGMAAPLRALRAEALARRPPLTAFAPALRPLELLARQLLAEDAAIPTQEVESLDSASNDTVAPAGAGAGMLQAGARPRSSDRQAGVPARRADSPPSVLPATAPDHRVPPAAPAEVRLRADAWTAQLEHAGAAPRGRLLWDDWWSGALLPPADAAAGAARAAEEEEEGAARGPTRSARLARRPEVRQAAEGEDEAQRQGMLMVQTAQPQEQAEDPFGLQRPTDRADTDAADEYADALSELAAARLVNRPGRPREVLLSDDPPTPRGAAPAPSAAAGHAAAPRRRRHPEWDYRLDDYNQAGATVLALPAPAGSAQWLEQTLARHAGMLQAIRRRFELLRAEPLRLRQQLDGDGIDLQAWLDCQAERRAGLPLEPRLYSQQRRARRDLAITLLVDVSGSTDGWIAPGRRVIDVEREALLLVCVALDGLAERFSVQAFSGEGAQGVVVRDIKRFDERYGPEVALRIAGLEPEHYTRAGAAVRDAAAGLMAETAAHRLLLLLSDGKPNDVDQYDGRYGLEDLRQAVAEARRGGIAPFCLTVDRHGAGYLARVFGAHHYALLPRPELLPAVLLDWLRKLVAR
jgi:nitric oxide reductase NorD protein